jgi:signal transduction histidine kinase
VLRVIDQGLGMREADLPHIFDPFFRADMATGIGGTGLGLSIVRDCVDRHQGQIYVESTPGQGSTFTVELPLSDT